ncbi:hypothetical protein [Achromobacter sp. UBA4530]|uniref:hypothetical protein n=1 Tax=Achromobacter sp. UBA4530 TaxID=1945912 RepID=UPI00257A9175|nr:hypothetical protein [Achromobacter sp. UBA4530]
MRTTIEIDLDVFEEGFSKLEQLEALLACTTGPGFSGFSTMTADRQEHVITLAADLAQAAKTALSIDG